jgi:hypothetical protein
MYEVLVYNEDYGSFIPARGPDNKTYRFQSWEDAESVRVELRSLNPGSQYKVEYGTVRPRRGRSR